MHAHAQHVDELARRARIDGLEFGADGFDKTKGFVGQELDLSANWDYTEDVSFGLLAGWFIPGEVYYDGKADPATDLVGSVKVSF